MRSFVSGLTVVAALFTVTTATAGAAMANRYSLAGGCYDVRSASQPLAGDAGPFRMQATALGSYLLYGVHQDFVAAAPGGVSMAAKPSQAAVWTVDGDSSRGFTLSNGSTSLPATFTSATGCAVYPEAGIDATGTPFRGTSPTAAVKGVIDTHSHIMGFEIFGGDWHCGRPWHPYGVAYALPDCASEQTGTNGVFSDFLDTNNPLPVHDTVGWPTFKFWPRPNTVAEEGDYYTGLERAWMGGLRVMVGLAVENEALCTVMTTRHIPCNDMTNMRIQLRDMHELQDYIDAQAGGPGKGFFRIVTNPFQARQVINEGKLAVVEGVEVSDLLGCGEKLGVAQCDKPQIDAGLHELHELGVSTFFPIHKFDNAFGGTKMDAGATGVIVNAGNELETGSFWNVHKCTTAASDADVLTTPATTTAVQLLNGSLSALLPITPLPFYPPAPDCNTRGLTDLGHYVIDKMVQQHFIVELDHMDALTAGSVLDILESHQYSGVMSGHAVASQQSPQYFPRIYRLGGFVSATANYTPQDYLQVWMQSRGARDPLFYEGGGYGSDMNGLAAQSHPGNEVHAPITYPFKSLDGRVTFQREQWGQHTFDLNTEGLSNYGMYPDWLNEVSSVAGKQYTDDIMRGAEAYLEMWERADGVPRTAALDPKSRWSSRGVGPLRLGTSSQDLLFAAGQPALRRGRSYRYSVVGKKGQPVRVVFGKSGKVVLIAETLRSAGGSTRIARTFSNGARAVRGLRNGKTVFIALAARSEFSSHGRLRADLRAAGIT